MNTVIKQTHESYIHAVRDIALNYAVHVRQHPQMQIAGIPALSDEQITAIEHAKLVYGRGHITLRGVTQYGAWKNGRDSDELVEICALGEESWEQLAGTTIHELAHVASGLGAGHSKVWKQNCVALGLRLARAAGTVYRRPMFAPEVRHALASLPPPEDGLPKSQMDALGKLVIARPCAAGLGTRGGTTHGPGSGRLRKYVCAHGQIIRASTDNLNATCNVCGKPFVLAAFSGGGTDGPLGSHHWTNDPKV